ncbi:hypothetical protein KSS87_017500 [Heliosperma pusillum]|nr:hypothetical protein KSS87_017500 [Heliosperma pusillum]
MYMNFDCAEEYGNVARGLLAVTDESLTSRFQSRFREPHAQVQNMYMFVFLTPELCALIIAASSASVDSNDNDRPERDVNSVSVRLLGRWLIKNAVGEGWWLAQI